MKGARSFENLGARIAVANAAMLKALRCRYPLGKHIHVLAQSNHKHPSEVEVWAHVGGEYGILRVRFASGHMTTVSVSQVVA